MTKPSISTWISKGSTVGRKITATSFIVLILIANFWLIKRFTGETFPQWSVDIFNLGLIWVAIGFLMLLPSWIYPDKNISENAETLEDDKSGS